MAENPNHPHSLREKSILQKFRGTLSQNFSKPASEAPLEHQEYKGPWIPPPYHGMMRFLEDQLWKPRQPDSLNTFHNSRKELYTKFSKLNSLVLRRKLELDGKIDAIEIEYNDNNKQKHNDKQTMLELREFTEQRLVPNTLSDVHREIMSNIQEKIREIYSIPIPEPEITMHWNLDLLRM